MYVRMVVLYLICLSTKAPMRKLVDMCFLCLSSHGVIRYLEGERLLSIIIATSLPPVICSITRSREIPQKKRSTAIKVNAAERKGIFVSPQQRN